MLRCGQIRASDQEAALSAAAEAVCHAPQDCGETAAGALLGEPAGFDQRNRLRCATRKRRQITGQIGFHPAPASHAAGYLPRSWIDFLANFIHWIDRLADEMSGARMRWCIAALVACALVGRAGARLDGECDLRSEWIIFEPN